MVWAETGGSNNLGFKTRKAVYNKVINICVFSCGTTPIIILNSKSQVGFYSQL